MCSKNWVEEDYVERGLSFQRAVRAILEKIFSVPHRAMPIVVSADGSLVLHDRTFCRSS